MTATIRGDVVRLIYGADGSTVRVNPAFDPANPQTEIYRAHLDARHKDGRLFTADEAALAATVTRAELGYVLHLSKLFTEAVNAARADYQRVEEIMRPYQAETIRELLTLLPADQQAEMEILIDRISGPDGCLDPGGESTVHYDAYRRALAELDA